MNRAIIVKTVRDTLPILLVVCAAVVLLETLFVCVLGQFSREMEFILQNPIFQRFSRVLLGSQLGGATSSTSFLAFGFAHPLLFALTWAFILTNCTRVLAGEIERGTADLLLTLPISRGGVFMSVSVVCVGAGIPLCIAPLVGAWLGEIVSPLDEPLVFSKLAILAVNLFALYLAIACATLFISTLVSRRGPVVIAMIAWLLGSFLLTFLSQFFVIADWLSMLGFVHYYRPLPVVRAGDWPIGHMATLVVAAAAFWTMGYAVFARRDIPAA